MDSSAQEKKRVYIAAGLLFLFTVLVYTRAMFNGFVNFDDNHYVTSNARVLQGLTLANLRWAFFTTSNFNWHPLAWLAHMADVSLFGVSPAGHHFTSVFFHAANASLLFLLLFAATRRLGRSLMVAALFAVHPLNVESVAWVSELKTVLSTFLFFLAIAVYALYVRRKSISLYLLLILLFALALMAKPMVITLPALLLILDYWPLRRIPVPSARGSSGEFWVALRDCTVEKLPLLLFSVASAGVTLIAQRKAGSVLTLASMPLRYRLQNAVYSCWAYIFKGLWPVKLAVFYPHPLGTLPPVLVALSAIGLLAMFLLAWRFRSTRYILAGWLWYLVSLSPVIGVLQVGKQAMADRYAYTSLLGIFVIAVWGIADAAQHFDLPRRYLVLASAGVLLVFASVTQLQIAYWHSSITLFRHALEVTRNNSIAEINLGQALLEMGRPDLADSLYTDAVRRNPEFPNAHYNLALIRESQQRYDEAAAEYLQAVATSVEPGDVVMARNNLASLYLQRNLLAESLAQYQLMVSAAPDDPRGYIGRGLVLFRQQFYAAALSSFQQAETLHSSPQSLYWIGQCHEARNENAQALQAYEQALRLDPQSTEIRDRITHLKQTPK
ncbi:MAG TPA: tetratricopeptide repeat protein [Candidatus Acidoferrum sp.]|nr:tetratricopeptide repeat protein [Candidatus Acidoferrum sp.]